MIDTCTLVSQRAGPSGTGHSVVAAKRARRLSSSDDDDDEASLRRPGPFELQRHNSVMPPGQFSNFDLENEEVFEQPPPAPRQVFPSSVMMVPESGEELVEHQDRRKKKTRRACAFLNAEAGVDGDASADDSDGDDASDCDGFIVGDDVFD